MISDVSQAYRGSIQAVILDWAGTAVDYGSFAPTAVFIRLFQENGVTITTDEARSGMGLMKKDHLRTILQKPSVMDAWCKSHGSAPGEEDVDRLFEEFVPMQLSVIPEFAEPIPGLLQVVETLQRRKIKIGSTTGYLRSMMEVLVPKAGSLGYKPECVVCPDEVAGGRPFPWMCYRNAEQLGVFPMSSMVKVGDTIVDIEEGLNAGMWTVGVSLTGNLAGLSESEITNLPGDELREVRNIAEAKLLQAGAHLVIDGVWDLLKAIDEINIALQNGGRP
jgi:phosphonoacetaldehyde hydrolase